MKNGKDRYDEGPQDEGPDGPDDPGPDYPGPDDGPRAPTERSAPTGPDEQGVLDLRTPTGALAHPPLDVPERRPGRLREGTVEVRLRLKTALGLDAHPGTVPGYGAVLAADARSMILRRLDGEWRVVLTDDGHLQHVLLARRRPPDPRGRHRTRGRSAAIVELQVPTTVLAALPR